MCEVASRIKLSPAAIPHGHLQQRRMMYRFVKLHAMMIETPKGIPKAVNSSKEV